MVSIIQAQRLDGLGLGQAQALSSLDQTPVDGHEAAGAPSAGHMQGVGEAQTSVEGVEGYLHTVLAP